jgi:hypothetical protein
MPDDQIEDLGIPPQNIRALLPLDNTPTCSWDCVLCTQDGNFRCEKYIHHASLGSRDNSCNEKAVQEKVFGGGDGCVRR